MTALPAKQAALDTLFPRPMGVTIADNERDHLRAVIADYAAHDALVIAEAPKVVRCDACQEPATKFIDCPALLIKTPRCDACDITEWLMSRDQRFTVQPVRVAKPEPKPEPTPSATEDLIDAGRAHLVVHR